jgi:hypothetical protein
MFSKFGCWDATSYRHEIYQIKLESPLKFKGTTLTPQNV